MAEVEYRPNLDSTKIPKVSPAGMGGCRGAPRLPTGSIWEEIGRQSVL